MTRPGRRQPGPCWNLHTTGESFFNFALRMSTQHKAYFLELYSPNESRQAEFSLQAEASLAEQARLEGMTDRLDFDQYLARYFAS